MLKLRPQIKKSLRPAGTKGFRGATLIVRTGGRSSVVDDRPRCRWWSWGDSNPRPPQCHCGALPAELQPQVCSDLSNAVTGEPVVDSRRAAFRRRCSQASSVSRGPAPLNQAFTIPGSLQADLLLLFIAYAFELEGASGWLLRQVELRGFEPLTSTVRL